MSWYRQPETKVWVMNSDVHLNEFGELIPRDQSEFIWMGKMVSNRHFPNVAPAMDAASIPLTASPQSALDETLTCL